MGEEEKQFLVAEYEQSWQIINAIDERRVKLLQSISTLVVAAIGAVGFLLSENGPLRLHRAIEASAILVFTIFAGLAAMAILYAERKSNIRYRKKVNLIRGLVLSASEDARIKEYLTRKDLGIKVCGDEQPRGIGRTLRWVFAVLGIELAGLVIALVYVWMRHCGFVGG